MRIFTLLTLFTVIGNIYGQVEIEDPEVGLYIEEQSIAENAISSIESAVGPEAKSYRLYAEVSENWELQLVFGDLVNPLTFNADNSFYQHPEGGFSTLAIDPALVADNPALAYDSWLTIGAENFIDNTMQVLPDISGFDEWEGGQDLLLNGLFAQGVIYATAGFDPQNSPDENGRILIAQLTSAIPPSGCVNMQFRKLNPDGTIFDEDGNNSFVSYLAENVCFDAPVSGLCVADIDYSGFVDISDILALLAAFGCADNCDVDLTGNGITGSGDLLLVLAAFGESCSD